MSRLVMVVCVPLSCFPRVSGDEPSSGRGFTADLMFSPRERG